MTTQLSQKDAVFKAVSTVKGADGSFDRKAVIDELFRMYRAGEWLYEKSHEKVREDKGLREVCGQILSNWLRKDTRLGGVEPSASRTGRKKAKPADDEMKRLMRAKVLLTTNGQPTQEIDNLIAQRTTQLETEKSEARDQAVSDAMAILAATEPVQTQ